MKEIVKVLGAYGGRKAGMHTSCIQVSKNIVIDAGNILNALGDDAKYIDHIFITHSRLEQILDIPFLIDTFLENRTNPLTIYALEGALENLKRYIFNNEICVDPLQKNSSVVFKEIAFGEKVQIDNCTIKPVKNNYTDSSCAYVVTKEQDSILFSSDTYSCPHIWDEINNDSSISCAIIEVTYPSRFEEKAVKNRQLTPRLLEKELDSLQRLDVSIFINHLKPLYIDEITQEISKIDNIKYNITILKEGDIINLKSRKIFYSPDIKESYIKRLNEIGYALTSEKSFNLLMEKILSAAKKLTNADAGTFYLMSDDEKYLKFTSVQTDSLNLKLGGEDDPIPWPDLNLYNLDGTANKLNVSTKCALNDELINLPDVYENEEFIFEGPRAFDAATGYRTKSMLVVPMKNHENEVIGVLQLINKQDQFSNIMEFSMDDEKLILSLASQAAVIVCNAKLTHGLEELLDSFIKSIADSISKKSKHTAGHINRVAALVKMIAREINEDTTGRYKDKFFTEDKLKEISVAAWMHDVGKIITPEYLVSKSRKLETVYDRINMVEAKFEILKKEHEIEYLRKLSIETDENKKNLLKCHYDENIKRLDDDFKFIVQMNEGAEFMEDVNIERIHRIAKQKFIYKGKETNLLSSDEVKNLSIRKGTLTDEERFIINNHAKVSYDMLKPLPFPKKMRNVPDIAGGHHEKICGGGYPFGLKGDQISFESRILAIADIFEALTASDRPYKVTNSLNQSAKILYFMAKDNELDREIVKFFIEKKLHLKYAQSYLKKEQIDEITVDFNSL